MAEEVISRKSSTISKYSLSRVLSEKGQFPLPKAIAHRGYKAKYPENTMIAFRKALEIGAHALETDIHITKDDVIVLSHDATLSRCFGRSEKIIDLNWSEIEPLQTIAEPHQTMPRLQDLLEYIADPGLDDIWILLDIKLDNESDKVMRLIADTINNVQTTSARPWRERVVLGCWAANYLPLAQKYLPGFPISHIGFSIPYARQFFKTENVSFNMLCPMLQAPGGRKFIKQCKEKERRLFAWTVNTEDKMDWCIRRKLDGVITDDPELFLKVCDEFDESKPEKPLSMKAIFESLRIWILAFLFTGIVYRTRSR